MPVKILTFSIHYCSTRKKKIPLEYCFGWIVENLDPNECSACVFPSPNILNKCSCMLIYDLTSILLFLVYCVDFLYHLHLNQPK